MKQLLFLLLFPCLAMAQYTGNAGQKITLGEQTTADGLVYRGVANDTNVITPFSDTSAYIILDTVNSKFYHYNRTTTYWSLAGGGVSVSSFSGGTTGLTPSTATTGAVTLGGTLAVANGGTNRTTMPNGYILHGDGTSVDTSNGLFWDRTNNRLGIRTTTPRGVLSVLESGIIGYIDIEPTLLVAKRVPGSQYAGLTILNTEISSPGVTSTTSAIGLGYMDDAGIGGGVTAVRLIAGKEQDWTPGAGDCDSYFSIENYENYTLNERLRLTSAGFLGIKTPTPTEALHVVGNGRFTAVAAGTFANNLNITSDGTLTTATSDEKYKYNILPITYGLNTILQLKPVNFKWIEGEENDLGFIAQDVAEIIPEAVNTNWNSDLLMRYESIIPILTKAIQEQNALIKALEQRILILENK